MFGIGITNKISEHYVCRCLESVAIKNCKLFKIYRYDPESGDNARLDLYELDLNDCGPMILDALMKIQCDIDSSLSFRKSCREGLCGSCSININGLNQLACTTKISDIKGDIVIYPLPHTVIIKDLIPDLTHFYQQYMSIQPWLKAGMLEDKSRERYQSVKNVKELDIPAGCIMCGCCSTACPSYWWNGNKSIIENDKCHTDEPEFLGPATLLQVYRWILDSRDIATSERLYEINNVFKLYRCHTIMNCVSVCPKDLNPAKIIAELKREVIKCCNG